MARTADRDRWLALALLLAVLALAYLLLLHPWWTAPMVQEQARIDGLLERDLRVRTQLAQAARVQERLVEARAVQSTASGFMPEASAELATAALVQRLEAVVSEASPGNVACAITNRVPQNRQDTDDRYARVVVEVRLQCGTPELAAVLMALEGGTPRLFIEDFNILPTRRFVLGANRTQGNGGIDASFQLVGYLRPSPVVVAPTGGLAGAD